MRFFCHFVSYLMLCLICLCLSSTGRRDGGGPKALQQPLDVHACHGVVGRRPGGGCGAHPNERLGGPQASALYLVFHSVVVCCC